MRIFIIVSLIVLSLGCSSQPIKIRMKNCSSLGSNLFECEPISNKNVDRK